VHPSPITGTGPVYGIGLAIEERLEPVIGLLVERIRERTFECLDGLQVFTQRPKGGRDLHEMGSQPCQPLGNRVVERE
jgi:hypothetical protein